MWARYGPSLAQRTDSWIPQPSSRRSSTCTARGSTGCCSEACIWPSARWRRAIYAGIVAKVAGTDTDAVYKELVGNLLSNAHMVPAGIVAVNRAQERGYSLAHGG